MAGRELTRGVAAPVTDSPKIIQVVMHDVLRPHLTAWLESRGLVLAASPFAEEDEMETWFVRPGDDLMRGVWQRR